MIGWLVRWPDRVATGLVLAAAVATTIGAGAAARQGTTDAIDVCALLPREEVSKLLGRPFTRARPEKRIDGPMECRYTAGVHGTVAVMVGRGIPKAAWDASMTALRASGARLETAPGVGDGAYFWDTRLYAHAGSHEITISTSQTPGVPASKSRDDAVVLAKAIVAKLTK